MHKSHKRVYVRETRHRSRKPICKLVWTYCSITPEQQGSRTLALVDACFCSCAQVNEGGEGPGRLEDVWLMPHAPYGTNIGALSKKVGRSVTGGLYRREGIISSPNDDTVPRFPVISEVFDQEEQD